MAESLKNLRETCILPETTRERFFPIHDPVLSPLRRIGVSLAGQSDVRSGYRIVRHFPPHHAVIYHLEGRARYACPSGEGEMRAGQRLIFPGRQLHAYEPIGPEWKMIWFHFDIKKTHRDLAREFNVRTDFLTVTQLQRIVGGFLDEWQHRRQADLLMLWAGLLSRFLRRDLFSGPSLKEQNEGGAKRLDEVWEIVSSDLSKSWTLEKLASHTTWTKAHFARLCYERYGETPMKRLARLRMENAQGLLSGTSLKVSEIASRLGYQNEFAFSAAFSRIVGLPPVLWGGRRKSP